MKGNISTRQSYQEGDQDYSAQLTSIRGSKPDIVFVPGYYTDAENIAVQLERRVSFRRAMKKAVQVAMDFGAEGIKVRVGGRLGGAEIARVEKYHQGRVPLHTLRAKIDYGFAEASTMYGKLGIKCWICHGDVPLDKKKAIVPAVPIGA